MDAFDADALIYAAIDDHELGRRVRALFPGDSVEEPRTLARVGSVLLIPEVLSKPMRRNDERELGALGAMLGRIDLFPADASIAKLATSLAVRYRLQAVDAVHLATAVVAGADRFVTNNRKDFPKSVTEIEITYPDDLPDP